MSSAPYSFHIITLGCPKNRVDSRAMRAQMFLHGFTEADLTDADIVIINSCSFVREAQEESIETVFETLGFKKEKKTLVGLVGCFPERFRDAVAQEMPELDFVMGTGRYHEIARVVGEALNIPLTAQPEWKPKVTENAPYSFFRIAKGCSRKCSFCVIPHIRGPYIPFTMEQINQQYREEEKLRGEIPIREAILVSQDTISNGVKSVEEFIRFFHIKEEIEWVRLHYLFPDPRTLDILDLFEKYPKLVSYMDIPFQHISPKILRSMNRPDNVEIFEKIIQKSLRVRPDMEFRTAFIIGFPGETEEDVETIKEFMWKNPVHKASFFTYSPEEGTMGARIRETVSYEEKVERINYLRDEHLKARKDGREALTGQTVKLLIDEITHEEIIARRAQDSPEVDEVVFLPKDGKTRKPGDFIDATLLTAMEYDWLGEIAADKNS